MLGTTVSHYRIDKLLGRGGMGVVYKARDLRLDRDVALKFLSPHLTGDGTAKQRFIHEAKTASSLNHPAVCTIHDIDEAPNGDLFIVMAHYDGETLRERIGRGPLSPEEATAIALQLARGLSRAHENGIVHRDVKPANIIVSPDGVARLLDFGLALLAGEGRMTRDGSTIGTVAYMSPEQLRGEPIDQRTDVWSLGVILYEMLAGHLPFRGEFEQGMIYSILNDAPLPPAGKGNAIPSELKTLLEKALQKNPAQRWRSMEELIASLSRLYGGEQKRRSPRARRHWPLLLVGIGAIGLVLFLLRSQVGSLFSTNGAAREGAGQASVAVLPFTDNSPERDQEYICNGIAEELVTALVRIPDLKVVSRTRALSQTERGKGAREIGRELGVTHVLEGSIRNAGGRLRITVGLVDVADGSQKWTESYDRGMTDILGLQENIARSVAGALRITLAPPTAEPTGQGQTKNPAAYESWLRGTYFVKLFFNTGREEDIQSGIRMFERAIARDSGFAMAYGGLAWAYEHRYVYGRYQNPEDRLRVIRLVRRAFSLDSTNGALVSGMGYIETRLGNYERGRELCRRGLSLAPRSQLVIYMTGEVLASIGLQEQAPTFFFRAMEIDPYYLLVYGELADCLEAAGKYEDAAVYYRRTFDFSPDDRVYRGCYIRYLIKTGKDALAEESLGEMMGHHPEYREYEFYRALLLAKRGEKDASLAIAKRAEIYALLRMPAEAVDCLERDAGTSTEYLWFSLSRNPLFDPIRTDPRFQAFLAKQKALHEERLTAYRDLFDS